MKIARYWATGEAVANRPESVSITLRIWRWSDSSQHDAEQRATAAAQDAARRMESGSELEGGYSYLDQPPREEIVEEITGNDGDTIATVTRNSYGSLILNTAALVFIDIDEEAEAEEPGGGGLLARLKQLLITQGRRKRKAKVSSEFVLTHGGAEHSGGGTDDTETALTARITRAAAMFPDDTFRLYQTAAGYRVVMVNRSISPTSDECKKLLSSFDADPLYLRLCEKQECFRARLTPKHWRCELPRPPNRFPRRRSQEEEAYEKWKVSYQEAIEAYATCWFLKELGPGETNPELAILVQVHDLLSRVDVDPESVLGLA